MTDQSDLASVQDQVVEFLAKLRWQPSNLRVQAGDVTVEISWQGDPAHPAHPAHQVLDGHLVGTINTANTNHTANFNNPDNANNANNANNQDNTDDAAAREYLTSPAVGVFYHAKEPGAEPFVAVGSTVEPGQQVGIVEAMKLMIPVEADRGGIVVDVLTANGAPVEYDEPLFALASSEN